MSIMVTAQSYYDGTPGDREGDRQRGHDYATLRQLQEGDGRFARFQAAVAYYRGTCTEQQFTENNVVGELKRCAEAAGKYADRIEELNATSTTPFYTPGAARPHPQQEDAPTVGGVRPVGDGDPDALRALTASDPVVLRFAFAKQIYGAQRTLSAMLSLIEGQRPPGTDVDQWHDCDVFLKKLKNQVEAIRLEEDKDARAELKKKLWAFTPSMGGSKERGHNKGEDATTDPGHRRLGKQLERHTGQISIDIDGLDTTAQAAAMAEQLTAHHGAAWAFISSSGVGVKAAWWCWPVPKNAQQHTKAWKTLAAWINGLALDGVAAVPLKDFKDASVKDVTRLCFLSQSTVWRPEVPGVLHWDATPAKQANATAKREAVAARQKAHSEAVAKRVPPGISLPEPIYSENGYLINALDRLVCNAARCGDFVPMGAALGHWNETNRLWSHRSKHKLDAICKTYSPDADPTLPSAIPITRSLMTAGALVQGEVQAQWEEEHKGDRRLAVMAHPEPHRWCFRSNDGPMMFDQQDGTMRPVEKTDYFTEALPYTPNLSATDCPASLRVLLESAFNRREADIRFTENCLAYMLFEPNRMQLIFHFMGQNGSGKGALTRMQTRLMGGDRQFDISNTKVGLTHDSHNVGLHGAKLALLTEDCEDWAVLMGWLRKASGGDDVKARRLYESDSYWLPYHGSILLITNYAIPHYAINPAFLRRYTPIRFTDPPAGGEDPRVEEDIQRELGSIFGYLFHVWKERVAGKTKRAFLAEMPAQSRELLGQASAADGFAGWAAKKIVKSDHDRLDRKAVVAAYLQDVLEITTASPEWEKERKRAVRAANRYFDGNGYSTHDDGKRIYAQWATNNGDDGGEEDGDTMEEAEPTPGQTAQNGNDAQPPLKGAERMAARLTSEGELPSHASH